MRGGTILSAALLGALAVGCGGGGGDDDGGDVTRYELTVTKAGTGTGTVTSQPSGIKCGSACAHGFASGTTVTLSAKPLDDSTFMGWDGACAGTGTCVVPVDAAAEVTATFRSFHHRPAVTIRRVTYSTGADGVYGTADDVVSGYNQVACLPSGDSGQDAWSFGSVDPRGQDGQWFTADDIPGGYWKQPGDTYGWNTRAPGADGQWFTADDPVTTWEEFGAVTDGIAINPLFDDPGQDGVWFTDDDVAYGYNKRFVDATGAEVERVVYSGPGDDGEWLTDDDEVDAGGYWKATYSHGNTVWASWDRQVRYTAPGPDGEWLTDDDLVGSYSTHTFADDSQYWTTENNYYDPGTDGLWFTADDRITSQARASNTY